MRQLRTAAPPGSPGPPGAAGAPGITPATVTGAKDRKDTP
jgi:hypothetical protein